MANHSWDSSSPHSTTWDAPSVGPVTEHATIGPSIVIKGQVSGHEALFIDGTVEGSIDFPDHRVTVGRRSHVKADIKAHDVVIMGSMRGNVLCSDLLDVRAESCIYGDIVTRRIRIDDGAVLKGSVEIQAPQKSVKDPEVARAETALPECTIQEPIQSEPGTLIPVAAQRTSPEAPKSSVAAAAATAVTVAKRVGGSTVLWKPGR